MILSDLEAARTEDAALASELFALVDIALKGWASATEDPEALETINEIAGQLSVTRSKFEEN